MDAATRALQSHGAAENINITALAKNHGIHMTTLWHRHRGRATPRDRAGKQQYLTPSEEKALSRFLLQWSDHGNPVRIKFLPSLAFSIARQRSTLHKAMKPPGRNWAQGFEKRHPELKPRRVRAMDWNRHEKNIYDKITDWFEIIRKVLEDPSILPENVYNMDETGIMLSKLGCVKVLVGKDDMRNYRGARVKRETVTAIECISGDGRYLDPMIIWPASTHRANWTTYHTPGWHYACSESGYTDSQISLEWLKRVFDPQTKERANQKPRVLMCDGFGSHETLEILEFCFENNIILCRIPSHTSHKLQPCDVAVFAPLKAAYRDEVEKLERGGVNTIGKGHFTGVYSPARKRAFTKKNILAAWAKSGLFPFNPDKVLRDIPKPVTLLDAPGPYAVDIGQRSEDGAVQPPATPVTPVTTEALMSLQELISQDAHGLDEMGKQRLQRRVQKLTNAANISFAERALQKDQIRFLYKMNNEAKIRRSTKSVVLGKAKVMSYEDLEDARARRAAKEQVKASKGKRGRKWKEKAVEVEPKAHPKAPAARMSEAQVAPVARMI